MLSNLHSNFEDSASWKCGYFYVEAFQIDLISDTVYLAIGTRNFSHSPFKLMMALLEYLPLYIFRAGEITLAWRTEKH